MNVFSLHNLLIKHNSGEEATVVIRRRWVFRRAWVSNASAPRINNREEGDDKAALYLEQPSRSQRATGAALCCSVTVEGTTSLLPGSTHLLWSPTGVSFITYSTAEGWRWWCVCACSRERESAIVPWIPVLSLHFVSTFCFWSPRSVRGEKSPEKECVRQAQRDRQREI